MKKYGDILAGRKSEILHWQLPDTHLSLCGDFIHCLKCTTYKRRITCPICIEKLRLMSLSQPEIIINDGVLNEICDKVLSNNPKSIKDYKKGKLNAFKHLKNQVMKLTDGKANALKVETILKFKLI